MKLQMQMAAIVEIYGTTLENCAGDVPEDSPMRPAPVDVLPAVQARALYNRCIWEAELFTFRTSLSLLR